MMDRVTAVFAIVEGKVQYKTGDNSPWQDAKVGDRISAGSTVRTALKGNARLQMASGEVKASASLVGGAVFRVPDEIANDGSYQSSAAVTHGRADFKVDEVGFANDFRCVPPSSSLAVEG
jgi:hypothetical protein